MSQTQCEARRQKTNKQAKKQVAMVPLSNI